jgi:ABC-2 type transport system ATP-binding protein
MMKILTGFLQPDAGEAIVDGIDVVANPLDVQERIGYLAENAPLYPELSVQAYLRMIADLRQIPPMEQPARLSEVIRATSLEDHLTRPIGQLSKGYRQRVGLAQAIMHQPKLLILDEPTIGLDPTQIVEVRHLIRRLARHSTILLSTHILSEVETTCNRVIILLNGVVKADARLSDLETATDVILVLQAGASDSSTELAKAVAADLQALQGVHAVEFIPAPDGHTYRVRATDSQDLRPAIFALARDKGWALKELRRDVRTLETVFNDLVAATGGIEP